jgi:hypothetical protein
MHLIDHYNQQLTVHDYNYKIMLSIEFSQIKNDIKPSIRLSILFPYTWY